jgi:hypothetical protein
VICEEPSMMRFRVPHAAFAALLCLAAPAFPAELTREIALIQRLGKSELDRRQRAAQPPTLADIQAAARNIDQYLQTIYREHKVQPNAPASDEVFLRRIYLDIAGRIPTLQETVAFLDDRDPNRRAKLIDKLLDSEAYIHQSFTWWADLLRIQSGNGPGTYGGTAYANWIKQAVRENKTYDRIVYELITADGYPWENGAAGFYLRDDGMPLDHMATTVQVFLGTALQCAQCHDHPFDKWSQYEFYEMAAFTYGVQTRTQAPNVRKAMEMAGTDEAARIELQQFARMLEYGVAENDRRITLPHDYKYKDARPHEAVEPHTIFGSRAEPGESQSLRQAYARWMIDRQNPRFTLTIANRMWKKVFGLGLIEPVDELTDDTQPLNAELVAYLTHKMEAYGYDLKQFQRMLFNTQLYQRQVTIADLPESEPYYFPGPLLHRMTAEQFWDSIVTLIIPEVDYRRGELSDGSYFRRAMALQSATPEQLLSYAREQAAYESQARDLRDKIREARRDGDEKTAKMLNDRLSSLTRPRAFTMMMDGGSPSGGAGAPELGNPYDLPTKDLRTWEGLPSYLVRAAELRTPADSGHFLRQFGQSDRDTINNASGEPNIVQVLAMFNGPMFQEVIAPYSLLMKNVNRAATPGEKLRVIYLSVLNREPTSQEKDLVARHAFRPGQPPDYAKIVWSLLNTREFSFVQ